MDWLAASQWVDLDPHEPDLEDNRYFIPCFDDPAPLTQSIRSVGMLNPPVVQEKPGGPLIPVLGRRRLQAARDVGLSRVRVRVISAEMPESHGFALAFWDNVVHRILDPASRAVVVTRLLELFPREVVAEEFLPALGIRGTGPRLERLAAVGRLEASVLALLAANGIQEKTAALLAGMEPKDRRCLMELIGCLKMNANKNAEIVSYLHDLSVLQGRSVADVAGFPDARAILDNEDLSTPERARLFRQLVREWKFPELVRREAEFRAWAHNVSSGDRIRIRPEISFESDRCVIEVEARDRTDAEDIMSRMAQKNDG